MPSLEHFGHTIPIRTLYVTICLVLLATLLAACGSSSPDDRSFAPEASGNTPEATSSPPPTTTPEQVDLQPNEGSAAGVDIAALAAATGPITSMTSGLAQVEVTNLGDGTIRDLDLSRTGSKLISASPDGSYLLVLDRSSGHPVLSLVSTDGKQTVVKLESDATPEATPVPALAVIQLGDVIVWSPDGSQAAVAIAGRMVARVGSDGSVHPIAIPQAAMVTMMTWSLSGQSLALGLWNREQNSAAIATLGVGAISGIPKTILTLAENDGRLIRSMAWGSDAVGIVFALRSAASDLTQANDLYGIRRLGDAMRLVASAGVAAPIAAVDQVAIAADGTTLAFSVQVPGQVGLRFDSIWIMDATASGVARLSTTGIRKVTEMEWTSRGLVIVGIRRVLKGDNGYQIAVVEQISGEAPVLIAQDKSPATPVASPVASPAAITPTS
ncbi:MAG TPA: hypothetical protein PK691_05680 [Thermomicrobiales bacterium]|nr:hypothetical protein [Thermomicrobiales bacterium]